MTSVFKRIAKPKPLSSRVRKSFEANRLVKFRFGGNIKATMVLRDWYFDRPAVQKAINRMRMDKKKLLRIGGQVRTISKRSIRKKSHTKRGRTPSSPGSPPYSRAAGHPMRLIGFGFNPYNATVVVGAEFLHRSYRTTVPSVHEHGKSVRVMVPIRKKGGKRASRKQARAYRKKLRAGTVKRPPTQFKRIRVRYPKRDFMVPAVQVSKSRYPAVWKESLRA